MEKIDVKNNGFRPVRKPPVPTKSIVLEIESQPELIRTVQFKPEPNSEPEPVHESNNHQILIP